MAEHLQKHPSRLEIRKELTPEKLAHAEALLQTYGLDRFRDCPPFPAFRRYAPTVPLLDPGSWVGWNPDRLRSSGT